MTIDISKTEDTRVSSILESMAVVSFVDPPNTRKLWTSSRIAIRRDGTTVPVLWILATAEHGTWDPETHEPYWKDRNWRNETPSNVGLVTLPRRGYRGRPTSIGIPSGTPEYYREYRKQNPDKVRAYQKKYHAKIRELVRIAQNLEPKTPSQTKLEDIISEIK